MTTKTRKPLTPGQRIGFDVPDSTATVYIQRGEVEGFRVWVEQGPIPAGWDYTYRDEYTARAEARRAAYLFHRYRTADAIEARREMLVQAREEQVRRQARGLNVRARLVAIDAELDTLETFGDRALLAQLRRDLDRHAA